jgi:CSLREA domain-containing protein
MSTSKLFHLFGLAVLLGGGVLLDSAPPLNAQTNADVYLPFIYTPWTVTTSEDELNNDGDCSLREAIYAANTNQRIDQCPASSVIVLPAGVFTLTLPASSTEDNSTVGDLDITGVLSIHGAGVGNTIINGNGIDRVFQIHPNSQVTITNLTITNGRTPNGRDGVAEQEPGGDAEPGGGIANAGTLTLIDSAIINNSTGRGGNGAPGLLGPIPLGGGAGGHSGNGGGIYNEGILYVYRSTIENNQTETGGFPGGPRRCSGLPGTGGGIYNANGAHALFVDSAVQNNHTVMGGGCAIFPPIIGYSGGSGGGIVNDGMLIVRNSLVNGNYTADGRSTSGRSVGGNGGEGGGILNRGTLRVEDSLFSGNYTGNGGDGGEFSNGRGGHGGALYNQGDAWVIASRIVENHNGQSGNGVPGHPYGGSGGGIFNAGNLTLHQSTVSHNRAGAGSDESYLEYYGTVGYSNNGAGGGIFNNGLLTVTMSTISGNATVDGQQAYTAERPGSGGNGGGIVNLQGLYLVNSTVSGNYTGKGGDSQAGLGGAAGSGAGIWNNGWLTITHTTIADNHTGEGGTGQDGVNGGSTGGGIHNAQSVLIRNTLVASNSASGEGPDCYGVIISHGYNLLQQQTSCTLTLELATNIVDQLPEIAPLGDNGGETPTHALFQDSPAIDAGACTDIAGDDVVSDQRGVARPQQAGCDIGAFEAEP